MRIFWSIHLLHLPNIVFAQGKSKDRDSIKTYCGPEFKKRDCAKPLDLYDDPFDEDYIGAEEQSGGDLEERSFMVQNLTSFIQEDELNDPYLTNLLGRDILVDLASGGDHDILVERMVTRSESSNNILEQLEAWYELFHRLEKRAGPRKSWLTKFEVEERRKNHKKNKMPSDYYRFCQDEGDLIYKTPPFGKGPTLLDSADWSSCDNYEIKKGTASDKDPKRKRKDYDGYVAEHVLERQMLQQFAKAKLEDAEIPEDEEDDNGVRTYCQYLSKYWENQIGNDQVLVTDPIKKKEIPPLYLVGQAWPQTRPNKNEMFILDSEINGAKARVFELDVSINGKEKFKMDGSGGVSTVEDAHALFKISVLISKYMAHEDVQKVYKTQGDRVAQAWKVAEDLVEKYWAKDPEPYKVLGLDTMWKTWLKEYTVTARDKLWADLKKWDGLFKDEITKFDAALKKLRKESKDNSKELPPDQKRVHKEIQSARAEFQRLEKAGKDALFGNPWD